MFELNCRLVESKSHAADEKRKLEKELEEVKMEREKLLKFQKQVQDAMHGYNS